MFLTEHRFSLFFQGFKGDGINCEEVKSDPCHGTKNPCHPDSACLSVNGIATCGPCPNGMTGNGKVCHTAAGDLAKEQTVLDPCQSNPCFDGVLCQLSEDGTSYECGACPEGLTGNGIQCSDTTARGHISCDDQPCYEGRNPSSFIFPPYVIHYYPWCYRGAV